MPDFIIIVLIVLTIVLGIADLVIAFANDDITPFVKARASFLFALAVGLTTWFTVGVNQPFKVTGEQVYPIQDVRFGNGALQQFYFNGAGERHDLTTEQSMTFPPGSVVHHRVYGKFYVGILFPSSKDGQDVVVTPTEASQSSAQK